MQLLCASDPAFRYAEHKKIKSFYDKDVFYYQGTEFIDRVEQLLVEQMRQYLGCTEVETRTISGQMSNMATFSALMDWKNRLDRKHDPKMCIRDRDGYCALVQDPVSMELASRGISFYGCFVLCGLILLAGVLASGIYRKREVP